jgi:hypothetical protein
MFALIAIGVGLVVGLLGGGSPHRLGDLHLRYEWPVVVLFVLQGFARGRLVGTGATSAGMIVWVACSAVLIILVIPDWRSPGLWTVLLGMGLNLLVVLLNSGMPVVVGVGLMSTAVSSGIAASRGFYQLASSGSFAVPLTDVLMINMFGHRFLASVGDLLLVVGVATFVASTMAAPESERISSLATR